MASQFLLLKSVGKLEGYLSRESQNLDKMKTNNNVSTNFLESKVGHFNELVDTLNTLFSGLTNDANQLFDRYELYEGDDIPFSVTLPSYTNEPVQAIEQEVTVKTIPSETSELAYLKQTSAQGQVTVEPPVEYQPEPSVLGDTGLDVTAGQERAAKILSEYEKSTEQDIAMHDPETDEPVTVFSSTDASSNDAHAESESEFTEDAEHDTDVAPENAEAFEGEPESVSESESESNDEPEIDDVPDVFVNREGDADKPAPELHDLSYVNSTMDGTRVDNDPIQIARVETAVERDGAAGRVGTDINVSSYRYESADEQTSLDSFMDEELDKFKNKSYVTSEEPETADFPDVDDTNEDDEVMHEAPAGTNYL